MPGIFFPHIGPAWTAIFCPTLPQWKKCTFLCSVKQVMAVNQGIQKWFMHSSPFLAITGAHGLEFCFPLHIQTAAFQLHKWHFWHLQCVILLFMQYGHVAFTQLLSIYAVDYRYMCTLGVSKFLWHNRAWLGSIPVVCFYLLKTGTFCQKCQHLSKVAVQFLNWNLNLNSTWDSWTSTHSSCCSYSSMCFLSATSVPLPFC